MIDFSLPPKLADLQARVRRFIAEQVIPLEAGSRARARTAPSRRCAPS